ncbi:phospholipid carrier-dependent glycosyltransferase [Streptomyces sp. NPDC007991]|uniref:ArnT family glycosyltransferase n=1 Tax=Streptomyces sp. NPDC007991 TaxID=3364803 RepID=UPI0036E85F4E
MSKTIPVSVARFRTWCAGRLWAVAGSAALLTGVVRVLGFGRSADVWVDEVYYWHIGHSVKAGGFPRYRGDLFFLHPPGFFYLEGTWERLFGWRPDVISGVYEMRLLNALLASVTAVVLVLLVVRLTKSMWAAVAVGLLFALDPFVLRLNQRVLIETSMTLWLLLGYLVLLPLAQRQQPARAYRRAAAGGLLFGLAVLTKDVAALITVLPLLVASVFAWPLRRRSLPLLAAGCATVPYAIYVGVVAAAGHFDVFWTVKTLGIERLLGHVQATGFHARGSPPLSQRIVEELTNFGSTYVLLALGIPALVVLLRRGGPAQHLMALWYLSAGFATAYAVLKGTLEEEVTYLVLVPTMVIVAMAAVQLHQRRTRHRRRVSFPVAGMVLALALALTWSSVSYARGRAQPDDGYAQMRQYMVEHLPADSPVISTSSSVDLILDDRYRVGQWLEPQDRARAKVSYMVVPWRLVEQGYSWFTPRQVHSLTRQGALLFSFKGRTYGTIAVYVLPVPHLQPPGTGKAGGGGG